MGTGDAGHDAALEAADDVVREAIEGVLAETGRDRLAEAAAEFERRAVGNPRLRDALVRVRAHEYLAAYWITHGFERVPGDPRKARPRAAGPWSREERARLAAAEGISMSALDEMEDMTAGRAAA